MRELSLPDPRGYVSPPFRARIESHRKGRGGTRCCRSKNERDGSVRVQGESGIVRTLGSTAPAESWAEAFWV